MAKGARKDVLDYRCLTQASIVLFFDIVGFTRRKKQDQIRLILGFVEQLRLVCNTAGRMFREITQSPPHTLISPSGDGVAIALWGPGPC